MRRGESGRRWRVRLEQRMEKSEGGEEQGAVERGQA